MLSKATKEEKILLFAYAAIAIAYGSLFIIKYSHIKKR
jgi:hypothetical protein